MKPPILRLLASWMILAAGLLGPSAIAQDYHDNVVIVLDASGSMGGRLSGTRMTKMESAKVALKAVLQNVPQSTHIGLLVFSAKNVNSDWVYPLGPRDDARLTQAIDLPQPDHGTPLGAYIKKGADRLLEERAKQFGYGSYRLLVVTDGEAGDKRLVEKFTPDVISRGIIMDVIGVGMRKTHTLATKVHSYRAANDPAALKRAVAEVFAEVASSTADEAQQEAFDLIAPIPVEMAAAIVRALATSGNHPIGDRPARSSASQATPRQTQAQPAAASSSKPVPGRSSRGMPKSLILIPLLAVGFFLMVIFVIVLLVIIKIRKRSRR